MATKPLNEETAAGAAAQQLVYAAVDEINEMLAEGNRIDKTAETPLIGGSSTMDSLGLLNLLVTLEDKVVSRYSISLKLADEITDPAGPFATIGTLVAYVAARIQNAGHA